MTNPPVGMAWQVSARAVRRAIGRYEFTEPQWRLVDKILFYSLERGEYRALIPRQQFFCDLCGLRKSKVSEELSWLHRQSVIESGTLEHGWGWYGLLPDSGWRVPLRVVESKSLVELEDWLDRLRPEQPDLIPAPPSLNDALREVFVESGVDRNPRPAGRVETAPAVTSSPVGNFAFGSLVPPGGTLGDQKPSRVPLGGTLSAEVPPGGTPSPARVDQDRLIESRIAKPRFESSRVEGSYSGYVEERLFKVIGEDERFGRSGPMWRRALEQIPQQVDELLGVVVEQKRLGRLNRSKSGNPAAAWMNTATRSALLARPAGQSLSQDL